MKNIYAKHLIIFEKKLRSSENKNGSADFKCYFTSGFQSLNYGNIEFHF